MCFVLCIFIVVCDSGYGRKEFFIHRDKVLLVLSLPTNLVIIEYVFVICIIVTTSTSTITIFLYILRCLSLCSFTIIIAINIIIIHILPCLILSCATLVYMMMFIVFIIWNFCHMFFIMCNCMVYFNNSLMQLLVSLLLVTNYKHGIS